MARAVTRDAHGKRKQFAAASLAPFAVLDYGVVAPSFDQRGQLRSDFGKQFAGRVDFVFLEQQVLGRTVD